MIMRGKYEMEYEAHDLVYRGKKVFKKNGWNFKWVQSLVI